MKNIYKPILLISIVSTLFISCAKEEVKAPTGPVYTALISHSMNVLGAQTNLNIGSFYSTAYDSVFFRAQADTNQSKIDLIYYFASQSTDSFVIASPKNSIFNASTDQNPQVNVKTWTVKNNTTFLKLNISPSTFNNLTTDSLFQNDLDSNVVATNALDLKIGDVIGFKTATGKLGAFHVRARNFGTALTRSMTIDVKIQQ